MCTIAARHDILTPSRQVGKMWVPLQELEAELAPMMNTSELDNVNSLRIFVVDEVLSPLPLFPPMIGSQSRYILSSLL